MGLLALAIAPGIAICIFIYFKDKYNKEPLRLLLLNFIFGMLCIVPVGIIEYAFNRPIERWMDEGIIYTAVFTYLIVGLTEEGSKFLVLRFYAFKHKAFDDPFDGIVYSIMIGMGFATLENISYVTLQGFSTGITRMFLSVPAHATFAVLMGYYVGLAKFDITKRKKYLFLAIFWPVVFHGTFDFFLLVGKTWTHFMAAVVSFLIAIKLSAKLIRKKQEISRNHHDGIDTITGKDHDLF